MSNNFDLALGTRIRTLRISSGFSQTALGERIGVSAQQMHKYERGFNKLSVSRLSDISTALNVSVSWFLDETDRERPISDRLTLEASRNFSTIASERLRAAAGELLRALAVGAV